MLRKQRPLADLLGEWVLFDAYLDRWLERDGEIWLLATQVDVKDYATARSLGRDIHHCWLKTSLDCWKNTELLHSMVGHRLQRLDRFLCSGQVYRYFRCNDTIDFGLELDGDPPHNEKTVQKLQKFWTKHCANPDKAQRYVMSLPLDELTGKDAAADALIQYIDAGVKDWREFGRSPKAAIQNLRTFRRALEGRMAGYNHSIDAQLKFRNRNLINT